MMRQTMKRIDNSLSFTSMKTSIKILVIFLISLVASQVKAADISKADAAYKAGNYEQAEALYSEILKSDGISAGLLYNLGNTYVQMGREADAMLCYERAKRLDPSNEMINQNLDYLATKITDANNADAGGKVSMEQDPESFIQSIYRIIAVEHQSNDWAVFAVLAFILFLGGLALYVFTPNVLARKTGFFSGLIFLGFTVAFLIFAYMSASNYSRQDQAILMNMDTELLESPDMNSKKVSTTIHKGTKLKILENQTAKDGSEWSKVRLNSDNVGWMKKDDLEVI